MGFILNLAAILLILLAVIFVLIQSVGVKKSLGADSEEEYSFPNMKLIIKRAVNAILNTAVEDLRLNETETKKRIKQKSLLRDAVRNCCLGDAGKREYVKEYIKTLLLEKGVNEDTISKILPFEQSELLTDDILFLALYHKISKEYGNKTYGVLCDQEWNIEKKKKDGLFYEINSQDIEIAFKKNCKNLSFRDKLDILTQLIYQELYGLDVADSIIYDESIDNCSGGTGGITELDYHYLNEMMGLRPMEQNCYDTIFVMYHGRQIRQSFLSFHTKERLIRVVKNIYRYDAPEMLTTQNGYIVASRQDNTRVTVARPPVSASWSFFLRKFKSTKYELETLLTGGNCGLVIGMLKWIIIAEQNMVVSGSPASGKTTLLKALVPFIDPRFSIRVAETVFETMFNALLPERNIHVMQERGKVKVADIINAFKKMDTDITILGEITEPEMAGAFIQIAQSGGRMTMCTLHHQTTEKLISYIRNGLMVYFDMRDSMIAEEQVVSVLHFDIHMAKNSEGFRYIERITEIIPIEKPFFQKGNTTNESIENYFIYLSDYNKRKTYQVNDIVIYDVIKKAYILKNRLSNQGRARFYERLGIRYREFMRFLEDAGIREVS